MTHVRPFLMFEGRAEEAMGFYVGLVPGSAVLELTRYEAGGPGVPGTVMRAVFSLAGLEVMCTDSPIAHGFTFTPAASLFVTCGSEEELEVLAAGLAEGGSWLMPLGDYGFSRRFGWLNDRFGVSWQLNLA